MTQNNWATQREVGIKNYREAEGGSPISGSKFLYSLNMFSRMWKQFLKNGVGDQKECHNTVSFVLRHKYLVYS